MKTGEKLKVFLPVVMTLLAVIFLALGGSENTMIVPRRVMLVLTLGTVLWSLYQVGKDGWNNKKVMVMTSVTSMISVTVVIFMVVKTGW
jgi:hypothetical protein